MVRGERWLVTGSTGQVGVILNAAAQDAGLLLVRASLTGQHGSIACDLRDPHAATRLLDETSPDRVVHLAAMSKPAMAHGRAQQAHTLNVEATRVIAEWCDTRRRRLVFASTEQVFSGRGPHREIDPPAAATVYGETKVAAERLVMAAGGLVVRLGWVLNDRPSARPDFIQQGLARLCHGETVAAVDDEHRTPIFGVRLADAVLRLAELDHQGVVHVAGTAHTTPYRLLRACARRAGLDAAAVRSISRRDLAPVGRPRDVRLDTTLLQSLLAPRPSMAQRVEAQPLHA